MRTVSHAELIWRDAPCAHGANDHVTRRPRGRVCSRESACDLVPGALFKAHVQGALKEEVMADPARFVNCDAAFPRTLLDQRAAGKKLCLITNSDWIYTQKLMSVTYDPFLPRGMEWTDLFDLIIVSAMKPDFFSDTRRRNCCPESSSRLLHICALRASTLPRHKLPLLPSRSCRHVPAPRGGRFDSAAPSPPCCASPACCANPACCTTA